MTARFTWNQRNSAVIDRACNSIHSRVAGAGQLQVPDGRSIPQYLQQIVLQRNLGIFHNTPHFFPLVKHDESRHIAYMQRRQIRFAALLIAIHSDKSEYVLQESQGLP